MILNNKNNDEGSFEEIQIENGFFVLLFKNETNDIQEFTKEITKDYIQFHFCLKGSSRFHFNQKSYGFDIIDGKHMLLYNTEKELPLHLELRSTSWILSFYISIEKFHALFSKEAAYIPFLSTDNSIKKHYDDGITTPQMAIVLNQIFNSSINSSIKNLYVKGKIYELLSLYFNTNATENEKCPFLVEDDYVIKIRKAKDIIIDRVAEPPTLQELATEVGLSLKKLKEEFKKIYGDTVFNFLLNYKMDFAKKLLETGNHNVTEVGMQIGYSTSSHFIAAYKKKYDITPKKYIQSLQKNT